MRPKVERLGQDPPCCHPRDLRTVIYYYFLFRNGDASEKYSRIGINGQTYLCIAGEAVGVSVASFLEGLDVAEVDFCGYSHLQRKISSTDSGGLQAEQFKLLTKDGQNGITLYSL